MHYLDRLVEVLTVKAMGLVIFGSKLKLVQKIYFMPFRKSQMFRYLDISLGNISQVSYIVSTLPSASSHILCNNVAVKYAQNWEIILYLEKTWIQHYNCKQLNKILNITFQLLIFVTITNKQLVNNYFYLPIICCRSQSSWSKGICTPLGPIYL